MIGEYCNVQNQLAKIMIDEIFHVLKWHKCDPRQYRGQQIPLNF